MPGTDISSKIGEAKKKVESLKAQAAAARLKKLDGYVGIKSIAAGKVLEIRTQPKNRRVLKGHFGKVYAVHWSGNSKDLVSASQDGKLIIWDTELGTKTLAIPLRSSYVMTCAFEQTKGNLVACGGLDNLCTIYNINQPNTTTLRIHKELAGHDGYLSCCRFINESNILTSSGDQTCMLWDIEIGVAKTIFKDHDNDVMCVSILPEVDPNVFVSGSCDSLAKVWDIRSGKCTMTLRGHGSDINSVCFFPDGKSFGTGSDDSTCGLFDMRSCSRIAEYKNENIICGITSVSFSKSGRILFAGYDDYNCLGWDILEEKQVFRLQGHENRVSSVQVSPSGEAVCTGSWDHTIRIWA